jgi:large subunit ribosomal protein L18
MDRIIAKRESLASKKRRIRKTLAGSAERPRLSVFRSEKHISGQIIDDSRGVTLVSAGTAVESIAAKVKELSPIDAAKVVGEALAEAALAKGISAVAFDRNGRRYAGRIQALADAARGKGLKF